jgi:hypothetical protein
VKLKLPARFTRRGPSEYQRITTTSEEPLVDQRRASIGLAVATVATVAAVAARGASAKSENASAASSPRVRLIAPRDGVVRSVAAVRTVGVTEMVVAFETTEEDRALQRIDLAMSLLDLQEKNLDDKQINLRKGMLENTKSVAVAFEHYASLAAETGSTANRFGLAPNALDKLQTQAAEQRAKAEIDRATATLALFDFNVEQTKARFGYIKDAVAKERAAVEAQKELLTLKSPISGPIKLFCYAGGFVVKGAVVAEIG